MGPNSSYGLKWSHGESSHTHQSTPLTISDPPFHITSQLMMFGFLPKFQTTKVEPAAAARSATTASTATAPPALAPPATAPAARSRDHHEGFASS